MMPTYPMSLLPNNCENETLSVNKACLDVYSNNTNATVFVNSAECYKCDFIKLGEVESNSTASFIINTNYPVRFYFESKKFNWCYTRYSFQDFGVYGWNISSNNCSDIFVKKNPEFVWLNISIAVLVYILLVLIYFGARLVYRSERFSRLFSSGNTFTELENDWGNPEQRDANSPEQTRRRKLSTRIRAVDCFRGIAISLMIFVNYGGGKYSFFEHTPWNGLTIADLVFPWFVWIMGFSIAMSLRSQLRTSVSRRKIFLRILTRSFVLINLGILINSGKGGKPTNLNNLRYPGVLQRLGLTYFIVATIETFFMKPQGTYEYGPWLVCQDIADSWIQWIFIAGLTSVQVALSFFLEVPGCPLAYFGPGGMHESGKFENCTGGVAGYVDRLVFGENHIYQHPSSEKIYMSTLPYDPEGILGLFTSVLLAYLGVQCARIMLSYHHSFSRVLRWAAWSVLTGVAAGFLCSWSKNDGIIPVNKNLWSLSYVLASASISYLMFAFLYVVIDHKKWWNGAPFIFPGVNSILLYCGHIVLAKRLPFSWEPLLNTHYEYLAMNLYATSLWIGFSYFCYRNNFFLAL